ncbi:hypothetical protein AABC73_14945 [Pseudomonas sp. G.S.17]|uniref:hypothetical protein n=1 Tax=Pseudomonas sp. G.S.17 TaxID=3137451 RepID=UPI00311CBFA2
MSILNLKFTPGAPAKLLPGMAVRCRGEMVLIGTHTPPSIERVLMAESVEWAQAIDGYVLEWLNNMGVPAKAVV